MHSQQKIMYFLPSRGSWRNSLNLSSPGGWQVLGAHCAQPDAGDCGEGRRRLLQQNLGQKRLTQQGIILGFSYPLYSSKSSLLLRKMY